MAWAVASMRSRDRELIGHAGALGDQGLGDGAAEALRGAGDERDLALESEVHRADFHSHCDTARRAVR